MKQVGFIILIAAVFSSLPENSRAQLRSRASPEADARRHAIFFPDFQKDVRNFEVFAGKIVKLNQAAPMDGAATKELKKDARDLEKSTSRILGYLLDGSGGPRPLPIDADAKSSKQKADLLTPLVGPVEEGLKEIQPTPILVAYPERSILILRLETIKEISHELAR